MHSFTTAPLLRLFIPFAVALVFKRLFLPESLIITPIWIVPMLLLGVWMEQQRNLVLKTRLFALISSLCMVLIGTCLHQQKRELQLPASFINAHAESKYMITRVKQSGNGKLSGEAILITRASISPDECLKVYFSIPGGIRQNPIPGDILLTRKKVEAVARGPSDRIFSFSEYLHEKHIFYTLKLKRNGYGLARNQGGGPGSMLANYQTRLGNCLDQLHTDTASKKMMKALVFGIDEGIDPETRNQFGITGTMHILSVSGLHVAAVFWMVNLLLAFPRHKLWGRVAKALLGIMALWIYSLLSGAEAPVLRSAFMFTFIQIGQSFRKTTHTFNLLILSAFILLMMNPETLFNLGFQLSFGAIAGILATQRALAETFGPFRNKPFKAIVELMLVSISAQWFTWPLCLHAFHTFPNYFLVSNLLLVPQSSLLLYLGIFYVLFSPVAFAEPLLNTLLVKALYLFNLQLQFFAELPFAQSGPITPDVVESVLLIAAMFFLAQYLGFRTSRSLNLAAVSFILIPGYQAFQKEADLQRAEFGLYKEKNTLHGWILQGTHLLVWPERDTVLWNKAERRKNRITKMEFLTETPAEIRGFGMRIVCPNNAIKKRGAKSKPGTSVYIIRDKNTVKPIASYWERTMHPECEEKADNKKKKCSTENLQIKENTEHHCLLHEGRFVIDLHPDPALLSGR